MTNATKWQLNSAQGYALERIKQLKAGASGPKTYLMTNATKWQLNSPQCNALGNKHTIMKQRPERAN
jgi:hypothetical protein